MIFSRDGLPWEIRKYADGQSREAIVARETIHRILYSIRSKKGDARIVNFVKKHLRTVVFGLWDIIEGGEPYQEKCYPIDAKMTLHWLDRLGLARKAYRVYWQYGRTHRLVRPSF